MEVVWGRGPQRNPPPTPPSRCSLYFSSDKNSNTTNLINFYRLDVVRTVFYLGVIVSGPILVRLGILYWDESDKDYGGVQNTGGASINVFGYIEANPGLLKLAVAIAPE